MRIHLRRGGNYAQAYLAEILDPRLSPGARDLLYFFKCAGARNDDESWWTIAKLASVFKVCERTIQTWKKELLDRGSITAEWQDGKAEGDHVWVEDEWTLYPPEALQRGLEWAKTAPERALKTRGEGKGGGAANVTTLAQSAAPPVVQSAAPKGNPSKEGFLERGKEEQERCNSNSDTPSAHRKSATNTASRTTTTPNELGGPAAPAGATASLPLAHVTSGHAQMLPDLNARSPVPRVKLVAGGELLGEAEALAGAGRKPKRLARVAENGVPPRFAKRDAEKALVAEFYAKLAASPDWKAVPMSPTPADYKAAAAVIASGFAKTTISNMIDCLILDWVAFKAGRNLSATVPSLPLLRHFQNDISAAVSTGGFTTLVHRSSHYASRAGYKPASGWEF